MTLAYKRSRKEDMYSKINDYRAVLKKDQDAGTNYQAGSDMDENLHEGESENAIGTSETNEVCCKRCKEIGHKTANSSACKYFKGRKKKKILTEDRSLSAQKQMESMEAALIHEEFGVIDTLEIDDEEIEEDDANNVPVRALAADITYNC